MYLEIVRIFTCGGSSRPVPSGKRSSLDSAGEEVELMAKGNNTSELLSSREEENFFEGYEKTPPPPMFF